MAWSIKSHPRRLARREAISPPPLPYSREIVMARMRLLRSRSSFMICSSLLDRTLTRMGSGNPLMSLACKLLRWLTISLYYKPPYYLCQERCHSACTTNYERKPDSVVVASSHSSSSTGIDEHSTTDWGKLPLTSAPCESHHPAGSPRH